MNADVCAVIRDYLVERGITVPIHIGSDDNTLAELVIITEVSGSPGIYCYGGCNHVVRRPQVEIRVRSATGDGAYDTMHAVLQLCDSRTILGRLRMQLQWVQDAGSRVVSARDGSNVVECREAVAQFACLFAVNL